MGRFTQIFVQEQKAYYAHITFIHSMKGNNVNGLG
jgi:hypothetical protein